MVQVGPMVPWFLPAAVNRLIHLLVMIVGEHDIIGLITYCNHPDPGVAKLTQRMDSSSILQRDGSVVKHASLMSFACMSDISQKRHKRTKRRW